MSKKLRVSIVKDDSQSEQLRIKVGDLIVSYNGVLVSSNDGLSSTILSAKNAGVESVKLEILRDEEILVFNMTLAPLGLTCEEVYSSSSLSKYDIVDEYKTQYGFSRSISKIILFLGWVLIAIGAITALIAFINGLTSSYVGLSLIAILPGLGTIVSGLLLMLGAQITVATVDNADNTKEIVKILNKKST